jgi:outer membrane protein assembly factor BamB
MSARTIIITLIAIVLLLTGCVGPRGWPGVLVDEDRLYVGTMDGRVLALNPESGSRFWQWEQTVEESVNPFNCVGAGGAGQFGAGMMYGPPAFGEGSIYVASYNGKVHSISSEGLDRWSYETEGSIVGGVVIDGGTLFVGDSTGELHAIDIESGQSKEGFPVSTDGKIWSRPTVQDGMVYFGSLDHKLYAVDAVTGDIKWDFETGGGIAATPIIVGGVAYIGSFDNKLYAVDASTGDEKWVFDGAESWFWGEAQYKDGIVYACNLDHNVYAIDIVSGELASSWPQPFNTGEQIKSSPVIVGDILAVASKDGVIYGINVQNGEEEWNLDLEVTVLAPLSASDSRIFVNAQDNRLYTIDGTTGQQDWSVTLVE